jgi:tRNA pseudouridine55 synthase
MRIENNKYKINEVIQDEFGRISGIFAVDKPLGKTSHDIVYEYRKKLNTKKVGHAGALDPFATGVLIILAGKATKMSNEFLGLDKEYIAELALGITTETLDPEGDKIIIDENITKLTKKKITEVIYKFTPSYQQYVPIYSSVKVKGKKLRKLARDSDEYVVYEKDNNLRVKFIKNEKIIDDIEIPKKLVSIYEIELLDHTKNINSEESLYKNFDKKLSEVGVENYEVIKIRVKCSKGTYIRKLAEDIGEALGTKAMLINLRRTQIGDIRV